ncbi:hypothetical protein, partial [uncultured Bilophila sp.]|uniref:hypothetical protein n=1 Tax=uncultured Bilophila sp. TaxID=529385 RepID=UPI00280B539F
GQLDNRQHMNFVLDVSVILTVMLVNVFPFAPAPFKIGIHQVTVGNFIRSMRLTPVASNSARKFARSFLA